MAYLQNQANALWLKNLLNDTNFMNTLKDTELFFYPIWMLMCTKTHFLYKPNASTPILDFELTDSFGEFGDLCHIQITHSNIEKSQFLQRACKYLHGIWNNLIILTNRTHLYTNKDALDPMFRSNEHKPVFPFM